MFKKELISADEVETIIGPSVQVEGNFNAAGDVIVEGTLSGTLKTEKNLKVGEGAKIYANVQAGSAFVAGEIHGNIKIRESLELTASAKIFGDIKTKALAIATGAVFFGKCAAGDEKKKTEKTLPLKTKDEVKEVI